MRTGMMIVCRMPSFERDVEKLQCGHELAGLEAHVVEVHGSILFAEGHFRLRSVTFKSFRVFALDRWDLSEIWLLGIDQDHGDHPTSPNGRTLAAFRKLLTRSAPLALYEIFKRISDLISSEDKPSHITVQLSARNLALIDGQHRMSAIQLLLKRNAIAIDSNVELAVGPELGTKINTADCSTNEVAGNSCLISGRVIACLSGIQFDELKVWLSENTPMVQVLDEIVLQGSLAKEALSLDKLESDSIDGFHDALLLDAGPNFVDSASPVRGYVCHSQSQSFLAGWSGESALDQTLRNIQSVRLDLVYVAAQTMLFNEYVTHRARGSGSTVSSRNAS